MALFLFGPYVQCVCVLIFKGKMIIINEKEYTMEEISQYMIGKGRERYCYRFPDNPDIVYKISFGKQNKQTLHEINYFKFLDRNNVPFIHIPHFWGAIKGKGYIGLKQEIILNKDGKSAITLRKLLQQNMTEENREKIKKDLSALFFYLYKYNILCWDMHLDNIVLNGKTNKLVLIDGIGSKDIIPLAQYNKRFGRERIVRKCFNFLKENPTLRNLFSEYFDE